MRIHLLSVGNRMPRWVTDGYAEYAKRLPIACTLRLVEIPPGRRGKGLDPQRAVIEEGERLLSAVPPGARVIALTQNGVAWNTETWATYLNQWREAGRDLALLIGGPDGLAATVLNHADSHWSLSNLTLPHPLVRVLLAEQIYRAWSLLQGHPYHRG